MQKLDVGQKRDSFNVAIENLRKRLLDISKRNPLTNTRLNTRKLHQVSIIDEISDQIYRIFYNEQKKFTFLPKPESVEKKDLYTVIEKDDVYVPEALKEEINAAHTDTKLQTELAPEELQKKLLTLYREARRIEEDLSINVLYLALGFLRYYDAESSDVARFAPLILLPVSLSRDDGKGMFRLSVRDEDLTSNQSLAQMLKEEHQLFLPELPETSDWIPSAYFKSVSQTVDSKSRWKVEPNRMVLRFFSFEKFMMSRDLKTNALKRFETSNGNSLQIVRQLLGASGVSDGPESRLSVTSDNVNLDEKYAELRDLRHILDADTSQTQVIAAAVEGRNLVVQGPPGTGKSQTIANIIGASVARGKRVLFVAEKKAALDVVYRRLKHCDLGHLCLELHSHKANRKHFYQDLKDALDGSVLSPIDPGLYESTRETRDKLNRMSDLVHTVDETTGNTPYLLMGRMAELIGKGVEVPTFTVDQIDSWSKDEFEERLNMLASLVQQIQSCGTESAHIWCGVGKHLTLLDQNRLQSILQSHESITQALRDAALATEKNETHSWSNTLENLGNHLDKQQLLLNMPNEVPKYLQIETVVGHTDELFRLLQDLEDLRDCDAELLQHVIPSALDIDWSIEANVVVQRSKSLLRWFNGPYRRAIKKLKTVCKEPISRRHKGRVSLMQSLMKSSQLRHDIKARSELGRAHFGLTWAEHSTDFKRSYAVMKWMMDNVRIFGSLEDMQLAIDNLVADTDVQTLHEAVRNALCEWHKSWDRIVSLLDLQIGRAFGATDIQKFDIDAVLDRTKVWFGNIEKLDAYHQLATTNRELERLGLGVVTKLLDDGKLEPEIVVDIVMLHRCEAVFKNMQQRYPELEKLNGTERSELVECFKEQDSQLKDLAAQEIVQKHDQNMPRGHSGQMGLIRGEMNKKTRHRPIRQLLDKAGEAVAFIKPIFLMSPLSISRFLTPGGLTFDLLLIDEASQVKPEQAIGAMMRAKQVVVVGDQKQMPPTSFFDKQISGDDTEDEEDDLESMQIRQTGDMESVLSLCDARGVSDAMLRWHYRSEHPSLIEVSNHEFYGSKLIYPPTPNFGTGNTGLQLVKVNGIYARSRSRNNAIEADRVCDDICKHIKNYPAQSLGVVALSTSQRDMIQNKVDTLCREHPDMDRYCNREGEEPFFVKNLENVQGDERDVIFVSIGYGPDKDGNFLQNLGPVSSDGGERRLNVLFTRSRKRCVVFASITHDDIRVDASKFSGPRILKQFLRYAETGETDVPLITGEEMDSPFEKDVARILTQHGYRVEPQVGSAGFKIDLAIYDPDNEGHFLLAIECDGARYHSSSWARERDRLRQDVLERKGWRFHRIWSTDWFYARDAEITKMLNAIESARARQNDFRASPQSRSITEYKFRESTNSDHGATNEVSENRSVVETDPYEEANFEIPHAGSEIHEVSQKILITYIKKILSVESPIHVDILSTRLARLWGKNRTGPKIKDTIKKIVAKMVRDGISNKLKNQGNFYELADSKSNPVIRDRTCVTLDLVKYPDYISEYEIRQAILKIVNASVSISVHDCSKEVSKLLGTNLKREQMRCRVASEAKSMTELKLISSHDGTLNRLGEHAI